jgi:pimeloyl-ACP methyl ester carboxylesterase
VLALLLARAGEPVTMAEIVDTLWWQGAPQSAVNTVHRSIGQLRRALEPHLAAREAGGWLVRAGGGYRLQADAASADLVRFRDLVERARVSRADAVDCYAQALGLWRGAVAEDIGSEVRENPVFAAISREYVVAAREAADVALAARGDRVPAVIADPAKASAPAAKPTMVLVHGAWADASSWAKVTDRLQRDGYTVLAAPNPLRGLSYDAAYLTAFLQQHTTGPVILAGHSYGGAVITNAALTDPDVKALVYVDAFVPDQGETILGLLGGGGDPTALFDFVQYPGAPAGDVDLYIKTALFPQLFAGDLPGGTARSLAAAQRPIAFSALQEPSGTPAWKSLPSWYVRGTTDAILPPATQLMMARRARSTVINVAASHLSMLSHPDVTAAAIRTAARATR